MIYEFKPNEVKFPLETRAHTELLISAEFIYLFIFGGAFELEQSLVLKSLTHPS